MKKKSALLGFIFQEIFAALAAITACFLLSKNDAFGNFVDAHVDYQGVSYLCGILAFLFFSGAGVEIAVAFGNNFFKKSYLYWSSLYLILMFLGFAASTFCIYADALLYPEFLAWLAYTAEIVVFLFAPVVLLIILMASPEQSRKTKIVEFSFGILLGVGALGALLLRIGLWNSLTLWSGSGKYNDLNFLAFLNVLVGILSGCFSEAGVVDETKEKPEEAKAVLPAQNPSEN